MNGEPLRLYRWFDADGVLLYVGISVSPSTRASQHIKTARWMKWAVRMEMGADVYPDRSEAQEAELSAIRREVPVFNIAGASKPWNRINSYLARRGEQPLEASTAPRASRSRVTPTCEEPQDAAAPHAEAIRVEPVMTIGEAAAELRVSRATVFRLLASGELAKTKVGRRTVITPQSFAAYVTANTSKEAAA